MDNNAVDDTQRSYPTPPEYTYVKIKVDGEYWIVAEGLLQKFAAETGISFEVLKNSWEKDGR